MSDLLDNSPSKTTESYEVVISRAKELSDIEGSKAKSIQKTFEPMVKMLQGFESAYNDLVNKALQGIDDDICKKAKRLRLDIAKIRTTAEKERKLQKEEYLRAGKAIDGVANILKWAVSEKEEKLAKIEKHFETIEKERLDALQEERVILLSQFIEDAHERDLSGMDKEVFEAYLTAKQNDYNARIEAEKKEEADRIAKEKADTEEREAQRIENEKLKAERIEREKVEALLKAKADAEAKAKAEKEEADKQAKIEAELKAKAPIKNKLTNWVEIFDLPECDIDNEIVNDIELKFASFKKWAKSQIDSM